MQVLSLNLGQIHVLDEPWPVHGFVLLHPELGAVLVDSGCGGPERLLRDFRVNNRAMADALADYGLSPADVKLVVNTHLHFDHCGQNPAFPHARMVVQRAERERVRRDGDDVHQWLDASGTRFELIDGTVWLADDVQLLPTPGHTVGHQAVVLHNEDGIDLFVGDAAFTQGIWDGTVTAVPELQADDVAAWLASLQALRAMAPLRVHFCHDG